MFKAERWRWTSTETVTLQFCVGAQVGNNLERKLSGKEGALLRFVICYERGSKFGNATLSVPTSAHFPHLIHWTCVDCVHWGEGRAEERWAGLHLAPTPQPQALPWVSSLMPVVSGLEGKVCVSWVISCVSSPPYCLFFRVNNLLNRFSILAQ